MMSKMATNGKLKFTKCVAAMDAKRGIGKNNSLPWRLKNEMAYFTRITSSVKDAEKRNAVILGRKTWESIPKKYRPLPNRLNVVLSKKLCSDDVPDGVIVEKTLDSALQQISNRKDVEEVFVVGGSSVYEEAIKSPQCDRIYLTHVQGDYGCDTFFPQFDEEVYKKVSIPDVPEELQEENGISYQFCVYQRDLKP